MISASLREAAVSYNLPCVLNYPDKYADGREIMTTHVLAGIETDQEITWVRCWLLEANTLYCTSGILLATCSNYLGWLWPFELEDASKL